MTTKVVRSKSPHCGPGSVIDIIGDGVIATTISFVIVVETQAAVGVPVTVYNVFTEGEASVAGPVVVVKSVPGVQAQVKLSTPGPETEIVVGCPAHVHAVSITGLHSSMIPVEPA